MLKKSWKNWMKKSNRKLKNKALKSQDHNLNSFNPTHSMINYKAKVWMIFLDIRKLRLIILKSNNLNLKKTWKAMKSVKKRLFLKEVVNKGDKKW